MSTIFLGSDSNPGGRTYNEDRCAVDHFATRSGLRLDVAVVCDGVGGEERGERAAQLAVDTLLASLRSSPEANVPRLITGAVRAANTAIFSETERLGSHQAMACTLAMALVVDGKTLHVANVGDSRIYLCRDGALQQLTRDHTFANVMVWLGKLTPDAAAANPDADKVMRALGLQAALQVDQGIYLATTDYGEANEFGRAGLALQTGDSLLVCSDGLVKNVPSTGQPVIASEEIIRSLQMYEGQAAARSLMSTVLGRIPVGDPVDNITLAVLQTEDPSRAVLRRGEQSAQQRRQRLRLALVALAVAVPLGGLLLLSVGAFAGFFAFTRRNANATATQLAQGTAAALMQTQTVEAWTDTPTLPPATPLPTLVPGEIAKLFDGTQLLAVLLDNNEVVQVPAGQTRFIAVNHRGFGTNADIHLNSATQLQLKAVTDARVQMRLLESSQIFVQSGQYPNGAEIELAGLPVILTVRGCLGTEYLNQASLTVMCFQGACGVSTDFGVTSLDVAAGQSMTLDLGTFSAASPLPIFAGSASAYWDLLQRTGAGRDDARQCDVPRPPLPTATTRTEGESGPAPAPTAEPPTAEPPTAEPPPPTAEPPPPTAEPPPPTPTT